MDVNECFPIFLTVIKYFLGQIIKLENSSIALLCV